MTSLKELIRGNRIETCMGMVDKLFNEIKPTEVVDIGAGKATRFSGAKFCDYQDGSKIDFNTYTLPFPNDSLDMVICEQVIEHLHNTTWFLYELWRILKKGGHLLLSTENLCSVPNLLAMVFQRAPFSLQSVCGYYVGGWKTERFKLKGNMFDPAFSGVNGHVRVLCNRQIRELFSIIGFALARKYSYFLNHYVLFHARKVS